MMNLRSHVHKLNFAHFEEVEKSPSAMIIRMYLTNKPYKQLYTQVVWQFILFLITLNISASIHQAVDNQDDRGTSLASQNVTGMKERILTNFSRTYNVSLVDMDRLLGELKLVSDGEDVARKGTMKYMEAFILAVSTFFTIGWDHVTPRTNGSKLFCIISSLVGIPITMLFVLTASKILIRHMQDVIRVTQTNYTVIRNKYGDTRINERTRALLLPILLVILLVYWLTTSVAITVIKNCSYIDALYYSFATFATIGFGDFVKGSGMLEGDSMRACALTIFCFLWVFFGIVLVVANMLTICMYKRKTFRVKKRGKKKHARDEQDILEETETEN